MTLDTRLEKITLAFALVLPCAASLTLMLFAPGAVSSTTYAVVVALLLDCDRRVELAEARSDARPPSNEYGVAAAHVSSTARIVTMRPSAP